MIEIIKGIFDVLLGFVVAALVLIADQISKYWVLNVFLGQKAYESFGAYFNVVRAWNTGVSFSMFNNYGNLGAWLLSGVALFIVGVLIYWLRKEKDKMMQLALGMIIGGALGNVVDRIRLGAVFDFLDVHIADKHWPAFNLADSFICIGAGLIILHSLIAKFRKEGK